MRILFITRKYPPSTGGMENAAFELYTVLAVHNDVTLVKYGGKNKYLPLIYFKLLFQALWLGTRHNPDVVYLQDGIMAPLGWIVKTVLRRPSVMTIHGLEATYQNPLYKIMVTPYIKRQNQLVAVSNETRAQMLRGLPEAKPTVIFNGLRDSFYAPKPRNECLDFIARASGVDRQLLDQCKLLHTNGRLVRRKGVLWFIDNVMKQLNNEQPVLYFISGKGKDQEVIESAIREHNLGERVKLLGRVSDELLQALYNTADLFIMPNIPIPNDMEGFGLVALEAASCGTTVVASKLEGIQDAIINGQNGLLVEPGNAAQYIEIIKRELQTPSLHPELIRRYTLDHYSWSETARQYEALMTQIIST